MSSGKKETKNRLSPKKPMPNGGVYNANPAVALIVFAAVKGWLIVTLRGGRL
jgi:hypothetical protein